MGHDDDRPALVAERPHGVEHHLLAAVRTFRDQGRTVVVVAHRASLVRAADDVVEVRSAPLTATSTSGTDLVAPTALAATGAGAEGRHP